MSVRVVVELPEETGQRLTLVDVDIAHLLLMSIAQGVLSFPLGEIDRLRCAVVHTATGEVWPVHLPMDIDGECHSCDCEALGVVNG